MDRIAKILFLQNICIEVSILFTVTTRSAYFPTVWPHHSVSGNAVAHTTFGPPTTPFIFNNICCCSRGKLA